jgi:L-proline amide hydrolase
MNPTALQMPTNTARLLGFSTIVICAGFPGLPTEATFAAIGDDPTVYHTMNGPSEFHCIGTIRTWSIIDRLDRIHVHTLLISGRYDEATEAVVQPFAERIANVRWAMFPNPATCRMSRKRQHALKWSETFLPRTTEHARAHG